MYDFLFRSIRGGKEQIIREREKKKKEKRKESKEKTNVAITEMENLTDEREEHFSSVDFEILQNCFWDHVL